MTDREKLLAALAETRDDIDFGMQEGLVDQGHIDSLDLLKIIALLDQAFDVRIPAGDIEPENFNSADAMLTLVYRYKKQ